MLHHDVGRAGIERSHVDYARNVIALDVGARSSLAKESRARRGASHGIGQQEFDRDAASELKVRRLDDDADASGSEHPIDPVFFGQDLPRL
jgi:hypothetical protein